MKVKELIEMLEEMGLEKEVRFGSVIEMGRSWVGCNSGKVSLCGNVCELEEDDEGRMLVRLDDDGEEVVDENVVLLRVDGSEDWFE